MLSLLWVSLRSELNMTLREVALVEEVRRLRHALADVRDLTNDPMCSSLVARRVNEVLKEV